MQPATLSGLVAGAYEAAHAPDRWGDFVVALERALGGGAALLFLRRPAASDAGLLVAPSLQAAFLERYESRDFAFDPFEPALSKLPVGGVACPVPDEGLVASRFHDEWMEPQGLLSEGLLLGLVERDERHGTAALVAFRRAGVRSWGARERRLIRSLLPHLRHALRLQREVCHVDAERGALASALDRLALGLLLVDRDGLVHAANRAAERVLAARDGLRIEAGALTAADPADATRLRQAFQSGSTEVFPLARPSGLRRYEVVVAPLPVEPTGLDADAPVAAVYVTDPEAPLDTPDEAVQRLFGLTPAEAALATELTAGYSLAEAAERLGVTRETARSRLKQIFAKTETGRQAELVRLLLMSPACCSGSHGP